MKRDKIRDMIRSILPSTYRRARLDKSLIKRALRRAIHIDVRVEGVNEYSPADLMRDESVAGVVWRRRSSDKLNHFMRWCEAITRGMSHDDKLGKIKALLPKNLIGEHAYGHWRAHCTPWLHRLGYQTGKQRLQSERDSLRFRLRRALTIDPALHGQLNSAIKRRKIADEPRRMLFGIHDIDDFVLTITCAPYDKEYRTTIKLIEAIEGGREAAHDRFWGIAKWVWCSLLERRNVELNPIPGPARLHSTFNISRSFALAILPPLSLPQDKRWAPG